MNEWNGNTLLVTKGVAGLGNRLLSVMGSIIYCRLTNRKLCIDWSDGVYSENRMNAFPFGFSCAIDQISIEQIIDNDIYPPIWKGYLKKSSTEITVLINRCQGSLISK